MRRACRCRRQPSRAEPPPDAKSPAAPEHTGPLPGTYAIFVRELRAHGRSYEYFLHFEPVAMVGYSVYIYDIGVDQANRVRRELGLPELGAARPVVLSPPALFYGETTEGEPLPPKTVGVRADQDVEGLVVACDWPAVRFHTRVGESPGSFELIVSPGPQPIPLGPFEIEAMVTGTLPGGHQLPPASLRLAGRVVPDVFAIPNTIRFGQLTGEEPAVDLLLQSRTQREFEVERVLINGNPVAVTPDRSEWATIHRFRVARDRSAPEATVPPLAFVVRTRCGIRTQIDVPIAEIRQ